MPRGRTGQTPDQARQESERRIEEALADNPGGLRFTQLREITKLHQDTLTIRLRELTNSRMITCVDRAYKISGLGTKDLYRKYLIDRISSPAGYVVVGGIDAGSIHRDETPILRSTMGFAFPATGLSMVGELKVVIHKYWALHQLAILVQKHCIDPSTLTGEKPLRFALESLRASLKNSKQVFAFIIDQEELKRNLNLEYMKEILRLAQVEDSNHIESKHSRFVEAFRRSGDALSGKSPLVTKPA